MDKYPIQLREKVDRLIGEMENEWRSKAFRKKSA